MTKTELIKEILKCGKDPGYFICTYAKVQHPTRGLVPFKLYPFQEDIVKGLTTHRKNIIVKGRQLRCFYSNCCFRSLVYSFS